MFSKDEFHLEEYKCLRAEINNSIEKIFLIVQFVPLASAAMIAWLATNATRTVGEKICLSMPFSALGLLWKVPIVLGFVGLFFSLLQIFHVFRIGDYLLFLENRYGYDNAEFGWERRLKRKNIWTVGGLLFIWTLFLSGCYYYSYELERIFGAIPQC